MRILITDLAESNLGLKSLFTDQVSRYLCL